MSSHIEDTQNPAPQTSSSQEKLSPSFSPFTPKIPSLTLPKGGGGIQGMGEKFQVNPVTGTCGATIPLPLSPGRSGFGPTLALSYDSGSGQGAFGMGWQLPLPSIRRKTEKSLPRYEDEEESDVFIFSGAEDLVPSIEHLTGQDETGNFTIRRYRPRIEGAFARIERLQNQLTGIIHWRVTTPDNIIHVFGLREEARVYDPHDSKRIFEWSLEASFDDRGNVIVYEYKRENHENVNTSFPQEKNRLDEGTSNHYLKSIFYGNKLPCDRKEWLNKWASGQKTYSLDDWHFQAVFDYGEHKTLNPTPNEVQPWACRLDPFSTYRSGFEIRTYRLCQRVLMFHSFPELGEGYHLVKATQFDYAPDPLATFLTGAYKIGYGKNGNQLTQQKFPPVEFTYSSATIDETVFEISAEHIENLPIGADGTLYQWLDLNSEGIIGLLTEQGGEWFYKPNRGNAKLGSSQLVMDRPAVQSFRSLQFSDLAGEGHLCLVNYNSSLPGYFSLEANGHWSPFSPFTSLPNLNWGDPNLKWIDLNGDGLPDLLITQNEVFLWYSSLGKEGFAEGKRLSRPVDEEKGPALVFADSENSIYLADMSGDGLQDIARIRNGEVCYWPNLGYGRFGTKVTMDGAPCFDHPDLFKPSNLRLADINGNGTTDLLYLTHGQIKCWFNHSGNSWSSAQKNLTFPPIDNLSSIHVIDLLGKGTACLVWSSPLPQDGSQPMRYIDLMGGIKPHLLTTIKNNLGAETRIHYASSTEFYLQDLSEGNPWITKLPFPVHVVSKIENYDWIGQMKFVTRYRYHHGYYDGVEREFRGFGYVEQFDTEFWEAFSESEPTVKNADPKSHLPPVLTKSWFHTGAYFEQTELSNHFATEYYDEDEQALSLSGLSIPSTLSAAEAREAYRSLKGQLLRQEVYSLEDTLKSLHPYTVTTSAYQVKLLQPQSNQRYAVFISHAKETLTYHYERDDRLNKDPRLSHQIVLKINHFGQIIQSASIVYPRRSNVATTIYEEQKKGYITYSEIDVANQAQAIDTAHAYRLPQPYEIRTYELTGLPPSNAALLTADTLHNAIDSAEVLPYEKETQGSDLQKRLLSCKRTLFVNDDLDGPLALGDMHALAIPYASYQMALTPGLIKNVYVDKAAADLDAITTLLTNEGKYLQGQDIAIANDFRDTAWWTRSGTHILDKNHFYSPIAFIDPWGYTTTVNYDDYFLLVKSVQDPLHNISSAIFDYHYLQPKEFIDSNGNRTEVAFDAMGLVVATAVRGKANEQKGDSLIGLITDLNTAQVRAHLQNPFANPDALLKQATTRILYDSWRYYDTKQMDANGKESGEPPVSCLLIRETHVADLKAGEHTKIQHGFTYSDGFGRVIQAKAQAKAGLVDGNTVDKRWIGTGWTIYNNKGKPIKQYEPYFTDTHFFEFAKQRGVSSILFYDALGRLVASLHPNHTYEKVFFSPWEQASWDVNDTVALDPKTDPDLIAFLKQINEEDHSSTWYQLRINGALGNAEKNAAEKAANHVNTPTTAHSDTLGRPFLTVMNNGDAGHYPSHVNLDIEGHQLSIRDTRSILGSNSYLLTEQIFDMLGRTLFTRNADSGKSTVLADGVGKPMIAWDSRATFTHSLYDALQRPTHLFAKLKGEQEKLVEYTLYGESHPNASAFNLRGKVFQHFDQSGFIITEEYDFKGNTLRTRQRLAKEYRQTVDWIVLQFSKDPSQVATISEPLLEAENFISKTTYDALNRAVTLTLPDASKVNPTYNETSLLESVHVNVRGADESTPFLTSIDYDAKGQRQSILYGNATRVDYSYDPERFRLMRMWMSRPDKSNLQDLVYTYDPIGNIMEIEDRSQQTFYFQGAVVDPRATYTYDALYRLIEATGREHIGQLATPQSDEDDQWRMNQPHPDDGKAMRHYTEKYLYDEVGNILEMIHQATQGGWTRRYAYDSASNRLQSTSLPVDLQTAPFSAKYHYDEHGSMVSMPQFGEMSWDFKNQLHSVNLGGGGTAYYVYDTSGKRVRKVIERSDFLKEERIYFSNFEIFRRTTTNGVILERETLHIMDDNKRIALVETKTIDQDTPFSIQPSLIRYQFDNHLGSAVLELNQQGVLISYEEYSPFGSTSYQAVRSQVETSSKRYRYNGKERDEETGLYYYGTRYYASWLGRWTAIDPGGFTDGSNVYAYVRNNPIKFIDAKGKEAGVLQNIGLRLGTAASEALAIGGQAVMGVGVILYFGLMFPSDSKIREIPLPPPPPTPSKAAQDPDAIPLPPSFIDPNTYFKGRGRDPLQDLLDKIRNDTFENPDITPNKDPDPEPNPKPEKGPGPTIPLPHPDEEDKDRRPVYYHYYPEYVHSDMMKSINPAINPALLTIELISSKTGTVMVPDGASGTVNPTGSGVYLTDIPPSLVSWNALRVRDLPQETQDLFDSLRTLNKDGDPRKLRLMPTEVLFQYIPTMSTYQLVSLIFNPWPWNLPKVANAVGVRIPDELRELFGAYTLPKNQRILVIPATPGARLTFDLVSIHRNVLPAPRLPPVPAQR